MSILIKDIEMPKEGFIELIIRDDGTVQQTGKSYRIDGTDYYTPYVGEMPTMFEAVNLPPHGRLIDADVFTKRLKTELEIALPFFKTETWKERSYEMVNAIVGELKEMPTIIPAEPPKEE